MHHRGRTAFASAAARLQAQNILARKQKLVAQREECLRAMAEEGWDLDDSSWDLVSELESHDAWQRLLAQTQKELALPALQARV